MNIDVRKWFYRKLSGIGLKDILIQIFFKYLYSFKICRKIFIKYINIGPREIGKIIYFEKKKNVFFHLHRMLRDNLLKIAMACIFIVIVINMLNISFSNAKKTVVNYVNIKVSSGDTVWVIAARNASNDEDIRELVDTIKTMNNLDRNALIYSGQTLKVPISANMNR